MSVNRHSRSLDGLCRLDCALIIGTMLMMLCFNLAFICLQSDFLHTSVVHDHCEGADRCEPGSASADLGARLQRLGADGTVPVLTSKLLDLLPGSAGISVPAGSPAMAAHLLATAVANLAQASFGPMQPFEGVPALKPLMSALEVISAYFRRPSHLGLQGVPAHTLGIIPDGSWKQPHSII